MTQPVSDSAGIKTQEGLYPKLMLINTTEILCSKIIQSFYFEAHMQTKCSKQMLNFLKAYTWNFGLLVKYLLRRRATKEDQGKWTQV